MDAKAGAMAPAFASVAPKDPNQRNQPKGLPARTFGNKLGRRRSRVPVAYEIGAGLSASPSCMLRDCRGKTSPRSGVALLQRCFKDYDCVPLPRPVDKDELVMLQWVLQ